VFEAGRDLVPFEKPGAANTGLLFVDPMFDEDAFEQEIFRFKPESPAEKLGVRSIDLSRVGSTLTQ
jgi:hypothetical protein